MPNRLRKLTDTHAATPRLTWYYPGGQRVELSERVSANWIIKIANYLEEMADGEAEALHWQPAPGWRPLLWAYGAWCAGQRLHVDPPGQRVEASGALISLYTSIPAVTVPGVLTAVVDNGPLALRWSGAPLPAGAVDANAEIMTHPDALNPMPTPAASDRAITGGLSLSFEEVESWPLPEGAAPGARTALRVSGEASAQELATAALNAWAIIRGGGSVVVLEGIEKTRAAEICAAELVTSEI